MSTELRTKSSTIKFIINLIFDATQFTQRTALLQNN